MQDFISSLPSGVINLKLEDTKLHISTDHHKSVINGTPADDYPVMPKIKDGKKWKISSKELKQALSQVAVAASVDDARPVLTGVNFYTQEGNLYVVATDSYRLAEKRLTSLKEEINILVPASAIQDLLRLLDDSEDSVKITSDEQQILFQKGDVELVTRLIEGKFPEYKKLIPSKFATSAVVPKTEIINIAKVSSLFARETAGSVRLSADSSSQEINIDSIASQLGENSASTKADVSGDGEITLNYVISLTRLIFVWYEVKSDLMKNLSHRSNKQKNDSYLHIIMPLKS